MKSILIIDDDPLIRKTLSAHLASKNYEIISAETGEDGLQKFIEFNPDLVILDIRLPDIDGLETLKSIKSQNKNASIIIMTAYDDMKTTIEAIKSGAFEYLVKPLDMSNSISPLKRLSRLKISRINSILLLKKNRKNTPLTISSDIPLL